MKRTTRARLVKGRTPKPVVMVSLERHAHKKKGTRTGLSAKGIAAARKKGVSFPKSFKSKAYSSTVERAAHTARFGQTRARRTGRKTYERVGTRPRSTRLRGLLSLDCIRDMNALVAMIEKAPSEEVVLRKWLDGKIPVTIVGHHFKVADSIIKKRFGLGKAVLGLGGKNILLRNVSHNWNVEAVFERLTGRKFHLTSPKWTMVRPTESLEVYFTRQGKAILSYRGKRYDVTSNLTKIVGKERLAKIVAMTKKMQIAHE